MEAYVLHAQQSMRKEIRDVPECGDGEVLLEVLYCGICRTDRKAYRMGQKDLHMPRILGHEIVGCIHQLGKNVKGYALGQRVVLHPGVFCGRCDACSAGTDQLCEQMKIFGFHVDGGFAQYCLIPAEGVRSRIIIPISDQLPSELAALAEPLACAINLQESMPKNAENLLIFGGGALGTLTALLWRNSGMSQIAIIEPNEHKRYLLSELGFSVCQTVTGLRARYDLAISCCPSVEAFQDATGLLKPRGTFGYFSGLTSDKGIDIKTLNQIHYKELRVLGSYGCALHHTECAVNLLEKGICDAVSITIIAPEEIVARTSILESEKSIFTMIKMK